MKRIALCLACAAVMLISGCTSRTEKAPEATPTPEVTAPVETSTPEPTAGPTPEPTAEPTPAPTPIPAAPPEYHWTGDGEPAAYRLLVGTSKGAAALGDWLRSEGAAIAEAYAPDGMDEPMFTLLFTAREDVEISAATEETQHIRLAADERILCSGLLPALLPAFEQSYGYTVEVYTGDITQVQSWAGSADADVALLTEADADVLGTRGFASAGAYASTVYSLEE